MTHQDNERPRPHGDPLRENVEDNTAQRQSDAPDAESNPIAGERLSDLTGTSDRVGGAGSSANGIPAFDEDRGDERRRQYKDNDADIVSRID